ncbi:MAG: hypothetical protein AAFX85_06490 [Pseudomonadota bacterium]
MDRAATHSLPLTLVLFVIGGLVGSPALSQIEHEGDVHPNLADGRLIIEEAGPIDVETGRVIYTSDFGDLNGGPHETNNPGYDTQDGVLLPDSLLGVEGTGVLLFWDGSDWLAADPGVSLTIFDALGSATVFTGAGVTNPRGYIDLVSGNGNLHTHIDMVVNDTAPTGAYLLSLSLFGETSLSDPTPPYDPSAPFTFIINRGLTDPMFQQAVDARISPQAQVPFPAWTYVLCAWLLMAVGRRRLVGGRA